MCFKYCYISVVNLIKILPQRCIVNMLKFIEINHTILLKKDQWKINYMSKYSKQTLFQIVSFVISTLLTLVWFLPLHFFMFWLGANSVRWDGCLVQLREENGQVCCLWSHPPAYQRGDQGRRKGKWLLINQQYSTLSSRGQTV